MKSDGLKKIVREKYGAIAQQGKNKKDSSCCLTPCCGPEIGYTVYSKNYESLKEYNTDADLSLGCGMHTEFTAIREGDHVLDRRKTSII